MLMSIEDISESLKTFKLSKKNIDLVSDIINKQLFLYKNLNLNPSNVSLIIVGKKIEGVDVIRIFDKNSVLLETLDTSYTRLKNLSSLENWNTGFILKILFIEYGKYVDVSKIKLTDVVSVNVKKVKNITYGVTDYNDVIKVDISLQDVKGAEYEVLKNAVIYTFNKQTKKKLTDLDCMVVGYS